MYTSISYAVCSFVSTFVHIRKARNASISETLVFSSYYTLCCNFLNFNYLGVKAILEARVSCFDVEKTRGMAITPRNHATY